MSVLSRPIAGSVGHPTVQAPVRLLCATRYGFQGPSSRYRVLQYVPHLETAGIRCTTSALFDDRYVARLFGEGRRSARRVAMLYARQAARLRRARDADVVLLEKDAFPFVPWPVERALARPRVPFLVDMDDAVFHQYDQARNPLVRAVLSGKFPRLFRAASAVLAGNAYIAEVARMQGARRVEYLPTVVDLERYPERPPRGTADGDRPLTFGWIGSPVTAPYLELVKEPLAAACRKTGARFRAIGAPHLRLDGVPVEAMPWEHDREVQDLRAIDVGIMPLPDAPWERGKCGLKLIQYMACGIPVVASPVGVNTTLVRDGLNGYLADTPEAWNRALLRLHDDPALRARMGREGRRLVEERYCLQRTAPRLARLVREVAEGS